MEGLFTGQTDGKTPIKRRESRAQIANTPTEPVRVSSMQAAGAPRVCVRNALLSWELTGEKILRCFDHVHELELKHVKMQIMHEAEQHFTGLYQRLFDLSEDDTEGFTVLIERMEATQYFEVPIPNEVLTCVLPSFAHEDALPTHIRVPLDFMQVHFNDEAMQIIKLHHVSSVFSQQKVSRYGGIESKQSINDGFERCVQKCCALVQKPLAYINRGMMPPRSMNNISICSGENFLSPFSTTALQWGIIRRLTMDGRSRVRYGPKHQDIYVAPLQTVFFQGQDYDVDDQDITFGADNGHHESYLTFHITGLCITFTSTHFVHFTFNEIELERALLCITTAKVISKQTGLPEDYCRKLWRHTVD
eukprot:367080-Rhodomonas_salina.1